MDFKRTWGDTDKRYDIGTVVADGLIEDEGGVAERALATAKKNAVAIGRLFQRLHEKGVISDADVEDFASYKYESVDE